MFKTKKAVLFVASILAMPAVPSTSFAQLSPAAEWATHAGNEYQAIVRGPMAGRRDQS